MDFLLAFAWFLVGASFSISEGGSDYAPWFRRYGFIMVFFVAVVVTALHR